MRAARRVVPLLVAGVAASTLASCATTGGPNGIAGIEEPSGVTTHDGRLLLVGDDEPGRWFSCPADGRARGLVPIEPSAVKVHRMTGAGAATDLEGIAVLADGRVVVLSEDARGLFDRDGLVCGYDDWVDEVSGRGLEGLAVEPSGDGASRVAVLWEGGYVESHGVAAAQRPRVIVHRLAANARPGELAAADEERRVELQPPVPPGEEPRAQRFRAPDFVWHRWPDGAGGTVEGWIVLMSSGWAEKPEAGSPEECPALSDDGTPRRWCHRWLQRFTLEGTAFGEPFDLDTALPESVRDANWEGLGWFDPGKALVLVYDESLADRRLDPQRAFVLDLPAGW